MNDVLKYGKIYTIGLIIQQLISNLLWYFEALSGSKYSNPK